MTILKGIMLVIPVLIGPTVQAQERTRLPDVSSTLKGTLVLPIAFTNPLFSSITEPIGQLDLAVQWPVYKGVGLGIGGNASWFGIKERALAPLVTTGEVRMLTGFLKLQYEEYTGDRTFYELSGRAGLRNVFYDCPTCPDIKDRTVFHWSVGVGYYVHATDNLAFGLTMGYAADATRFGASDLGLEGFPGRREKEEVRGMRQLVFGLGFSTRFRRADDGPRGW